MSDDNKGAGPDGGTPAWYGDDADTKGFVENKGWKSPGDAIGAYRNLEQFVGADKAGRGIIWPKDDADTEGWKAIHARLGVPETPDAYKIPVPEGGSPEFAKAIAPVMHKLGLTAKQAEGLAAYVNEYEKDQSTKFEAEQKARIDADLAKFKGELGASYDATVSLAKRAAGSLGIKDEQFAGLEEALGLRGTVELFAAIGKKLGEDTFVGEGSSGPKDLSVEAARARLKELGSDKGFMEKLLSGDRLAKDEKDRLDANVLGMTLEEYRKLVA